MRIPMYDIIIELMKGDGKVFDTNYNYRGKRKVAIYARVSTEHEAQLSALANQKDWYSPILGIHPEWEVVKLYADEGVTGTAAYKRRSFMQMIDDALNGKFSLILTREVSRFEGGIKICKEHCRYAELYTQIKEAQCRGLFYQ